MTFNFADYNRGTKYLEACNFTKAVQFLKRELKLNEFKELYLNLGNAYKATGDFVLAGDCYLKAGDDLVPFANGSFGDYDLAWSNYGLWKYANGDSNGAIELYAKALAKNPGLMDAVWNYASAILRKLCSRHEVDTASAWKMYEFRFKRNNPVALDRSIPLWDGISKHERIVVLAEQGFGDKIMFGRYAHCLREYCDEVVIQIPPHLDCIFEGFSVCRAANSVPGDVVGIPICSLAGRFGHLDVEAEWLKDRFIGEAFGHGTLNVGIEWAGSVTHSNNRNRSVGVERFVQLNVPGVKLFSFKAKAPKGITALNTVAGEDWTKTCEALAGLDLVVTVDTSVAHMAATMGIPVWMMQPSIETDFRWGEDSMGEDNIWYPSMKIIRNPGSWDKVFKIVRAKLVEEVAIKQKCVQANFIAAVLESKENV